MTTEPEGSGDDPRRMLSSSRELVRRVRATQRATWFPLLVFAAVTFAAIPAYQTGRHIGRCVATDGGQICTVYPTARFVYWPVALVLAYVVIAAFYVRRSRARGVGTRVRPYVIAGIVLALAGTGATLWQVGHPLSPGAAPLGLGSLLLRLPGPGSVIGVALLILAWAERNWMLAALTLLYLAVVLFAADLGVAGQPRSAFMPQFLLDGGILLLGAIGFALAQRPSRTSRPSRPHAA